MINIIKNIKTNLNIYNIVYGNNIKFSNSDIDNNFLFSSILDNDVNFRNFVLRLIVLNRIHLIKPDGNSFDLDILTNFVEYKDKDKDKVAKLVPHTVPQNINFIASLLFEIENHNKEPKKIKNKNNPDKLFNSILVRSFYINQPLDQNEMLANITAYFNLNIDNIVNDLHIYTIVNEKLYNDKNIYESNEVRCKINKTITWHNLSSTNFFDSKFLSSFYKQATPKIIKNLKFNKDYLDQGVAAEDYRRETANRMNIFIFHGFEWGIIKLYFEYWDYKFNSGTTSLRHKVSLPGFRVSKFVTWTGLESKLNFSLKPDYYERFIDSQVFDNDINANYKSNILNFSFKSFSEPFKTKYKDEWKLNKINNLIKLMYLNEEIDNLKTNIKLLESVITCLERDKKNLIFQGCVAAEIVWNTPIMIKIKQKYETKLEGCVAEAEINKSPIELKKSIPIELIQKELNLLKNNLITVFKYKILIIIDYYTIKNFHEYFTLDFFKKNNSNAINEADTISIEKIIREINFFYPMFVQYITTIDFSGNIKTNKSVDEGTAATPRSHKKYSASLNSKKSGKDKRQLHTLINYFNKSNCSASATQPPNGLVQINSLTTSAPHSSPFFRIQPCVRRRRLRSCSEAGKDLNLLRLNKQNRSINLLGYRKNFSLNTNVVSQSEIKWRSYISLVSVVSLSQITVQQKKISTLSGVGALVSLTNGESQQQLAGTGDKQIKVKYDYKTITVPFVELTEIKFINILLSNLNLSSLNSILFQYFSYEKDIRWMLGSQIGINVKDTHNLNFYKLLYSDFLEMLSVTMDRYCAEQLPDFIIITLKELILEESLKKNQISKIQLSKGLVKVRETMTKFNENILPITYNTKYFGNLLHSDLRLEYLNKIIEKAKQSNNNNIILNSKSIKETIPKECTTILKLKTEKEQIIFLQEVIKDTTTTLALLEKYTDINVSNTEVKKSDVVPGETTFFKVFVTQNKKYLIISSKANDFIYNRVVFIIKTGRLLFLCRDILGDSNESALNMESNSSRNDNYSSLESMTATHSGAVEKEKLLKRKIILNSAGTWMRNIGNTSIVLNKKNKIILFIQDIKLESIKYRDHKKLIKPKEQTPFGRHSSTGNKFVNKFQEIVTSTNPKFGVFDLETLNDIDNKGQLYSWVYALGFVTTNQSDLTTYYLTDHFSNTVEGSAKLVLMCIDNMLVPKYDKFIFYVHNLGRFDVIFIYKILLEYNLNIATARTHRHTQPESEGKLDKYILEPLYRDNQIIRLTVKLKKKNKVIKIAFVDSLNLLNNSLSQLCIDYGVETIKGIFPYVFVNKDNLNYVGQKPDIKYYNKNINFSVYSSAPSDTQPSRNSGVESFDQWDLREEALKYLTKDLLSLLEVLVKFQEHLWIDHNMEMTEGLTISSLAKTKFLKYYLQSSKIPLINTNNLFNFIYSAYYGGITEVYIPYGQNLTYLDVNSLYPFSAKNPMPGLDCQWIESFSEEGLDLNKLFGIFHAVVETNDLYIGLLPLKTKAGLLFPNGKFEGSWTSIELQFAKKYGYKIKVTKGFQFNKEFNVFDNYVNELSKLKDVHEGSQRQVIKSLLNNLLGRFALNFVKPITKTVKKVALDKILATKEIKTLKQINEDNFIVTYIPLVDKEICESHNLDYFKVILNEKQQNIVDKVDVFQDTSIIISAFTTAYARIHMHQIKLDIIAKGGKIYYTDTDSLCTSLTLNELKKIMPDRIGDKLGQLKFEYDVDEAFFSTNKTYFLSLKNGKEIKKAKGVVASELFRENYQDMYFKSKSIQGNKIASLINHSKGSVTIKDSKININWNSYKKREKIYNPKTKLWTDTRPLYIDNITRSIIIYQPKNIIKFHYINTTKTIMVLQSRNGSGGIAATATGLRTEGAPA